MPLPLDTGPNRPIGRNRGENATASPPVPLQAPVVRKVVQTPTGSRIGAPHEDRRTQQESQDINHAERGSEPEQTAPRRGTPCGAIAAITVLLLLLGMWFAGRGHGGNADAAAPVTSVAQPQNIPAPGTDNTHQDKSASPSGQSDKPGNAGPRGSATLQTAAGSGTRPEAGTGTRTGNSGPSAGASNPDLVTLNVNTSL